jgi:peptide/nickel transport system substrate-binding protein
MERSRSEGLDVAWNALQTNADDSNKVTPWLATGSVWSPDFKTLTFTIRSGVNWSDGQPFSAADVVYTYMAIKGDPALDLNAIWSADGGPLTSVALQGTDQIVFSFSGPAQTYFFYVADQIPIIPQHIWSKLDQTKPDAEANTAPIGTGPYLIRTAARTTSSTCATPTTGRARPPPRCRRSPKWNIPPS